jgi:hypothetical protein
MLLKGVAVSLGYLLASLASLILMPIVAVGGGMVLFTYAVVAELSQLLTGNRDKAPDPTTARALAAKICTPYGTRRVA